jgi:uncharacterized membrane protein YjgN (DUF898 family)
MITQTSSLSSPMPISPMGERSIQGAAPSIPKPTGTIESSPIEFSGTGSEYFRIWIVNLLLIMVTFGIYYPWAKVRKIKYFYNNTHISGHALDFHASPWAILRGYILAIALFFVFSQAMELSGITALLAASAIAALSPYLFRGSNRFRMANTSWRGMRMRFTAKSIMEAYTSVAPAVFLFLMPSVLGSFAVEQVMNKTGQEKLFLQLSFAASAIFAVTFPFFFWRMKRYQHNHYAWGPLQSEYRSEVGATYKVFGMTVLMVALIVAVFSAIVFLALPSSVGSTRSWSRNLGMMFGLLIPLFFVFLIVINILPRAYFTSTMQNLIWSRTGNRHFRFKSDLATGRFMGLQFKNYLLIMVTLGLYWPFAVVATKRMQLEAVSLKTRVSLDALSDAARARENDAAGDMAADIFGFDIGL